MKNCKDCKHSKPNEKHKEYNNCTNSESPFYRLFIPEIPCDKYEE